MHTRQKVVEHGANVDLLGKPRDQDRAFTGLRNMQFGSGEVTATPVRF